MKRKSLAIRLLQLRHKSYKAFDIIDSVLTFLIKLIPIFLILFIPDITNAQKAAEYHNESITTTRLSNSVLTNLFYSLMIYLALKILQKFLHYKTYNIFKTSIRFSIFSILLRLEKKSVYKYGDKTLIAEMELYFDTRQEMKEIRIEDNKQAVKSTEARQRKDEIKYKKFERNIEKNKQEKEMESLQKKVIERNNKLRKSNSSTMKDYYKAQNNKDNKEIRKLSNSIGGKSHN